MLSLITLVAAQSCPPTLNFSHPYSLAPGYSISKFAQLDSPRGITIATLNSTDILFATNSGYGIIAIPISPNCSTAGWVFNLLNDTTLNHGIAVSMSGDGTGGKVYASSSNTTWAWDLDGGNLTLTNRTVVVSNMANADHDTRTLLLSSVFPDLLVINRGSNSNLDEGAAVEDNQRAMVKVFNLTNLPDDGYDFTNDGIIAGWGLRNDVGLVEDWEGGLWTVENSADDITYTANSTSTDVHLNNPGEKLNYLGPISNPTGSFHGYPNCFAVYNASEFPTGTDFTTGDQFALSPNSTLNDTTCANISNPPRLTFQAHSAPLDIKFLPNSNKSQAFVTFHGSWDRAPPTGYKIVRVPFTNSSSTGGFGPVADLTDMFGYEDVLWNPDISACPNGCFRPVGLAFDSQGRMFVSSDSTGDIFMITLPANVSNANLTTGGTTPTGATTMSVS
ncbi:hypothetical protein G7K_4742-t1 [Saitoella complicata NRRL Y-17804]|uniref:Pyrroloquinoline quinone-dependent pyranose dehydrogenase beta-propeller domain-containing protein n=1 Tax=Saitoella complicata (strain BCRC 22490 / CBS 7301 / JCM 7358 / NBRC 10748 / NRRL Y-17804) TaxID=698492 RepID=A0A0E9NLE1_SAICN|nr:hypothetical protein G7K_4742-t1 [Saitoella complicata NRRL Y-17804]